MNTALSDQLAAAIRDTKATAERWAADSPNRETRPNPGPVIQAVVETWLSVYRATDGQLRCPHITDNPMPMFGRAHEPGVMRCAPCLEVVALSEVRSDEDYTCDACRWVYPGGVHDAMTVLGPLTLLMGLCTDCARLDTQ